MAMSINPVHHQGSHQHCQWVGGCKQDGKTSLTQISVTHTHTHIHTYIHTHTHTHTHTHIHTYTHTYIHKCIHTYIHSLQKDCHLPISTSILKDSVILSADVIEHIVDPYFCYLPMISYLMDYALAFVLSTPD